MAHKCNSHFLSQIYWKWTGPSISSYPSIDPESYKLLTRLHMSFFSPEVSFNQDNIVKYQTFLFVVAGNPSEGGNCEASATRGAFEIRASQWEVHSFGRLWTCLWP